MLFLPECPDFNANLDCSSHQNCRHANLLSDPGSQVSYALIDEGIASKRINLTASYFKDGKLRYSTPEPCQLHQLVWTVPSHHTCWSPQPPGKLFQSLLDHLYIGARSLNISHRTSFSFSSLRATRTTVTPFVLKSQWWRWENNRCRCVVDYGCNYDVLTPLLPKLWQYQHQCQKKLQW